MRDPPAACNYVGQLVLSRKWGSSQLAKLRDSSALRRRCWFLYMGNQPYPPRPGSPLRFCDTVFPDWCFPGKDTLTPSPGHMQESFSRYHKFRGKVPQMARGWAVKRAGRMADSGCGSTGSRHFTPITCRRELRQSCATPRLRISSFSVRPRCRPPATPCWSQPARW